MKKYRLRFDAQIVGYAEETKHGVLFKGKELMWFMRGKPRYNELDEAIGLKDKLNREIYEMDIVSFKTDKHNLRRKGIVLWEKRQKQFMILELEKKAIIPIFMEGFCLFNIEKLEIISHLFNHPELQKMINL